ncbi:MAG: hypothetical protein HXX10_05755 [Rhodoplanes sp.]|uniref:hypothetical protein n=1 Tax=Rhodoplanes sp. TaxID=1968906 RepID=UPI0017D63AC4|nr:hypothetical protein [Rhodoplanes sp.]NVO13525.1 hypothetical protein [Rhodoplanes sp.]
MRAWIEAVGAPEDRQGQDLRRSGAMETPISDVRLAKLSNRMANTIATSNRLPRVCQPVDMKAARAVDEARLEYRPRGAGPDQNGAKSLDWSRPEV